MYSSVLRTRQDLPQLADALHNEDWQSCNLYVVEERGLTEFYANNHFEIRNGVWGSDTRREQNFPNEKDSSVTDFTLATWVLFSK
jgi:hypothetical protein